MTLMLTKIITYSGALLEQCFCFVRSRVQKMVTREQCKRRVYRATSGKWHFQLDLRITVNDLKNRKVHQERGMPGDNIVPNEVEEWILGKENAQESAWRVVMNALFWTVAEYRARDGQLYDAQRFGRISLNGRNAMRLDPQCVHHGTDIRA